MLGDASKLRVAVIAMLLLAVIVLGQATASVVAPASSGGDASRAIGRAGFAYVTGLRTFAAAVLWNRLEPQFHSYYDGRNSVGELKFMLPTLYLVVTLDPQFAQAYYTSSFIVFKSVSRDAGIALAQEAVDRNPTSGFLRSNLVQLLFLQDQEKNRPKVMAQIGKVISPDTSFADATEEFETLANILPPLRVYGDPRAEPVAAYLSQLKAQHPELSSGDHDHDGDGKQDH